MRRCLVATTRNLHHCRRTSIPPDCEQQSFHVGSLPLLHTNNTTTTYPPPPPPTVSEMIKTTVRISQLLKEENFKYADCGSHILQHRYDYETFSKFYTLQRATISAGALMSSLSYNGNGAAAIYHNYGQQQQHSMYPLPHHPPPTPSSLSQRLLTPSTLIRNALSVQVVDPQFEIPSQIDALDDFLYGQNISVLLCLDGVHQLCCEKGSLNVMKKIRAILREIRYISLSTNGSIATVCCLHYRDRWPFIKEIEDPAVPDEAYVPNLGTSFMIWKF